MIVKERLPVIDIYLLLYVCIGQYGIFCQTTTPGMQTLITIPPLITIQPPTDATFRVSESVSLPCIASGEPTPTYFWQMNQKNFSASGNDGRVATQPGVGTLIFASPLQRDEAIYQCFAYNQVGTAVSVIVNLRWAYLDPFPLPGMTPQYYYPQLGMDLTLPCTPPASYPMPDVFWATLTAGQAFQIVSLTDRVNIDPIGNLQIANVLPADSMAGATYTCIAQNMAVRSYQQGAYAIVVPQGQNPVNNVPKMKWQSPTQQMALVGQRWTVMCIFSGNPTPRVTWTRLNGEMPQSSYTDSFGMKLVITNVQFNHAGTYQCSGINEVAQAPTLRSMILSVQSAPYWVQMPTSVDGAEGDTVVYTCIAAGVPIPTTQWFINGVVISQVAADPRRIVETNTITFINVTQADSAVIQCNCTNTNGYIFANAYLNINTEPPVIMEPPEPLFKASEGQTVNLTCLVYGSPRPLVVWYKGSEQLTGGAFTVLPQGHLQIADVTLVDAGLYTCTATNRLGSVSASGYFLIRRRTQLLMLPQSVMIFGGMPAKFTCTATTDPAEAENLVISWQKDHEDINIDVTQRIYKNILDNSLTVSGTIALDTGTYTCIASNGLDSDQADAQLIVQTVPDPPSAVQVLCYANTLQAMVQWLPGRENYAPILNFILQFNTSFASDTWVDISSNISQTTTFLMVTMTPYANYSFRLLARNEIGVSPPSLPTQTFCTTQPDRPYINPSNVIGEGDLPDNLVIFWTPMPPLQWHDPSFWYIVSWQRTDVPNAILESQTIEDPLSWYYVVPDKFSDSYIPFNVSVQAVNSRGYAYQPPQFFPGHSGENVPTIAVNDLIVVTDSIAATTATILWTHVDVSPSTLKGFFRGYRIQYGRTADWPANGREVDDMMVAQVVYPRPRLLRLQKRDVPARGTPLQYILTNLPPFKQINVQIRVLTKYYAGPPSNLAQFETPSGPPGPPSLLTVIGLGPTFFDIQWFPPAEPNGVVLGYNISYQIITGMNFGRLQYREQSIANASVSTAQVAGLMPNTTYRIYLAAFTAQGAGDNIFVDQLTLPANVPSPPTVGVMSFNDTWALIAWEPSRSSNPGSVFYVQYRARAWDTWMNTPDEYIVKTHYLNQLDPGTNYQVRVVAKNGAGLESAGEWQEFITYGVAPGRYFIGVSAWFYGIFICMFILIVFVVVFMVLKKYTDVWWERKEAEIEEQVRQLQAEEAAVQMGFDNYEAPYTDQDTGSIQGAEKKPPTDYYPQQDYPQQASFQDPPAYPQRNSYQNESFEQDYPGYATGYKPASSGYDSTAYPTSATRYHNLSSDSLPSPPSPKPYQGGGYSYPKKNGVDGTDTFV